MLRQMYYELFEWCGHGLQFHQYLYLQIAPPLCMQRWRYSFCGIHTAALLEHTVKGRCLHHADYEGVCGVSHCSGKTLLLLPIC